MWSSSSREGTLHTASRTSSEESCASASTLLIHRRCITSHASYAWENCQATCAKSHRDAISCPECQILESSCQRSQLQRRWSGDIVSLILILFIDHLAQRTARHICPGGQRTVLGKSWRNVRRQSTFNYRIFRSLGPLLRSGAVCMPADRSAKILRINLSHRKEGKTNIPRISSFDDKTVFVVVLFCLLRASSQSSQVRRARLGDEKWRPLYLGLSRPEEVAAVLRYKRRKKSLSLFCCG